MAANLLQASGGSGSGSATANGDAATKATVTPDQPAQRRPATYSRASSTKTSPAIAPLALDPVGKPRAGSTSEDPELLAALSEAISDAMPMSQSVTVADQSLPHGLAPPPAAVVTDIHAAHDISRASSPAPPSPSHLSSAKSAKQRASYPSLPRSWTATNENVPASNPSPSSPREWPASPGPIDAPAAPSSATPGDSAFQAQTDKLPSAKDGAFIRKPGQAWQPVSPSEQQHYRFGHGLGTTGSSGSPARAFSTATRASGPGAISASAALENLLSDRSSRSRPTSLVDTSSEPATEDTPLTAGLQSIWERFTRMAAAPDADGVVRDRPSSAEQSSTESSTGANSFFEAISSLRKAVGLDDAADDGWVRAHRAEIESAVESAEQKASKDDAEGLEVEDGKHDGKTINKSVEQLLRVQDKWDTPRLPVCFSHGLFGFDQLTLAPSLTISYWRGVVEALEANGCEVLVCRVPTSASIQERAAALKMQIEDHFAGREINLIAHSMGGLDSRYMISQLRPSFTVKSLTTITTPHRGSSFANFMLYDVIRRERLPRLLSMLKTVGLPGGGRAFENLTTDSMEEFNKRTPDSPDTKYFSWGAAFNPSFANEFRIPHGIIYDKEGPNDGLVSVHSSQWGKYMGTLKDVNHLQIVGWRTGGALTRMMFGMDSVFNATSFYLQICEDLAREGF